MVPSPIAPSHHPAHPPHVRPPTSRNKPKTTAQPRSRQTATTTHARAGHYKGPSLRPRHARPSAPLPPHLPRASDHHRGAPCTEPRLEVPQLLAGANPGLHGPKPGTIQARKSLTPTAHPNPPRTTTPSSSITPVIAHAPTPPRHGHTPLRHRPPSQTASQPSPAATPPHQHPPAAQQPTPTPHRHPRHRSAPHSTTRHTAAHHNPTSASPNSPSAGDNPPPHLPPPPHQLHKRPRTTEHPFTPTDT